MVPKFKMIRIYWNLVHVMFRKSLSWFWCQRLFLLNIYHLLGPNWSQNWKCSEFIEIWHIWYLEYPNLDFDFKTYFLSNDYQLLDPNWSQKEKCSDLLKFDKNIWYELFLTLTEKLIYLKHQICQISKNSEHL